MSQRPPWLPSCYACYVTTIPHRELRNNSSEILRRVAAGETFEVTNNGKVVAIVSPPKQRSRVQELEEAGLLEPPKGPADFRRLHRVKGLKTSEILADLRGDR